MIEDASRSEENVILAGFHAVLPEEHGGCDIMIPILEQENAAESVCSFRESLDFPLFYLLLWLHYYFTAFVCRYRPHAHGIVQFTIIRV